MPATRVMLSLLAVVAACGVDVSQPSEPTGTIVFVLDTQTCPQQEISIDLFVDGAYESTGTFSPGTQRGVEASVGPHVASATITNSTTAFEQGSMVVKRNVSVDYLMVCR